MLSACLPVVILLNTSMSDVVLLKSIPELSGGDPCYGVIGYPVGHSLSPAMQLAGFEGLGKRARYVRIELAPEELEEGIASMRAAGLAGWNITLPHKQAALELMDEVDASAEQLNAVNTVIHEGGKCTGFNTDGLGWIRAIREKFSLDVKDLRILMVGCGGVGQALARQAARESCERLVLTNRSVEKAQALAETLKPFFVSDRLLGAHERLVVCSLEDEVALARELDAVDLIVNATSLGLKPTDPSPLSPRLLEPHHCVYDTITRPTRLQEATRNAGGRAADGLSMLLHQGALSLELWTGKQPPLERMRTALLQASGRTN